MCLQIFRVGFGEAASPLWRSKKLAERFWRTVRGKTKAFRWATSQARGASAKNYGDRLNN